MSKIPKPTATDRRERIGWLKAHKFSVNGHGDTPLMTFDTWWSNKHTDEQACQKAKKRKKTKRRKLKIKYKALQKQIEKKDAELSRLKAVLAQTKKRK